MFLALDIGNTQTSIGVFIGGVLQFHWRVETKASRTEDEYLSLFFSLFSFHQLEFKTIRKIAVASVVPQCNWALANFCRVYFEQEPLFISAEVPLPFKMKTDFPKEIGADRLANAAYAIKKLKLPSIIIDIGTGTTFDVVTEDESFAGGIIFPGVRIALESLSSKTSKLPSVAFEFPERVVGKNTVECIQSGVFWGYCDLLKGLLARIQKEIGPIGSVALTGGDSKFLSPKLEFPHELLPNLTLYGIHFVLEHLLANE